MEANNETFGDQLNHATRTIKKYVAEQFRKAKLDITRDQWSILNSIQDSGGTSHLTALSQGIGKDAPTLTKMVDLLVKKGYLKRKLDDADRRKWNLVLTTDGKRREKQATKVMTASTKKLGANLNTKDLRDLKRILGKITSTVE